MIRPASSSRIVAREDEVARIGVGIIGVSATGGWAGRAHIPALSSLPEFEIRVVAGSDAERADNAARHFGLAEAVGDHLRLVGRADVDLVIVTVRVPAHRMLVDAALDAGKAVFCEWPLGRDAADAKAMLDHALRRNLFHVVGLQARANPAVRYVRELVAAGYVGEVLSASVVAPGMGWSDVAPQRGLYTLDAGSGATMLQIPFGHAVDALCWCLGEFRELNAVTAVRQPDVRVKETGEMVVKTAADQIAVIGRLESGAVASVHMRGGVSRMTNLLFEIKGAAGELALRSEGGQMQQSSSLMVWGGQGGAPLTPMPAPAHLIAAPDAPLGDPFNIAQGYRLLARGLGGMPGACPTFADALVRHRLLETIEQAAATGCSTSPLPRPWR